MKKKLLSMAVVAAFAGGATTAQAVNVNPDGLGQVLIFPFYSVEGGNDTYINIVNTTDSVKAVKVRFLEAMNSQEVLDFNLYLSPFDHWSAVVTRGAGEAAIMRTWDNSCTVPQIPAGGVAFRNDLYSADSVNGLDRTREGYVEIIEMGTVNNDDPFNPATWATHTNTGLPANCANLVSAWNTGGVWRNNPDRAISEASGGLYGYGILINVPEGTAGGYDALAMDGFWEEGTWNHAQPGDTAPSLVEAFPRAQVLDGNQIVDVWTDLRMETSLHGIDAVSATIMHDAIMNDYVLDEGISATTDWVINFPTKRFYTNFAWNPDGTPNAPAAEPFTAHWSRATSQACEPIGIDYWDREERQERITDVDFSPSPEADPISLCKEVNVLRFNTAGRSSDVLFASSRVAHDLDVAFENGWARLTFDDQGPITGITDDESATYNFWGLPVIGFAVQKFVNGDMGGLLSNYTALIHHKATRDIESVLPQ